jgi:hypothetical protein
MASPTSKFMAAATPSSPAFTGRRHAGMHDKAVGRCLRPVRHPAVARDLGNSQPVKKVFWVFSSEKNVLPNN